MGFRKTDGGDSSNVEVFSNSVHLVDSYNTELLLKVLYTGTKIIFVPIPSAKVESRQ
jgi:hypothetical protein